MSIPPPLHLAPKVAGSPNGTAAHAPSPPAPAAATAPYPPPPPAPPPPLAAAAAAGTGSPATAASAAPTRAPVARHQLSASVGVSAGRRRLRLSTPARGVIVLLVIGAMLFAVLFGLRGAAERYRHDAAVHGAHADALEKELQGLELQLEREHKEAAGMWQELLQERRQDALSRGRLQAKAAERKHEQRRREEEWDDDDCDDEEELVDDLQEEMDECEDEREKMQGLTTGLQAPPGMHMMPDGTMHHNQMRGSQNWPSLFDGGLPWDTGDTGQEDDGEENWGVDEDWGDPDEEENDPAWGGGGW